MAQPSVEVKGLKEFRQALRGVSADLPKALRAAQKEVADDVADRARSQAGGMGGIQAKAAGNIRAYATQVQASIGFPSGGIAGAAFWGTLRRTGWYAAARYADDRPNNPRWVGSSWEPGVAGTGPYAINDALASYLPQLDERYLDMITDLAAKAFPD
jgi:hypothetical protein